LGLLKALGQLHGRSSHEWNTLEQTRGRQVWCKATETVIRNDEHYYSTVNYLHHNPVKHGYTTKWTDWPWSSAHDYLERVGRPEALRLWQAYPVEEIGQGWDDAAK
jgi:putative transposase